MQEHENTLDIEELSRQAAQAADEVCAAGKLKKGELLVVGCSTSEVLGQKIGTAGTLEVARALLEGLQKGAAAHGAVLCVQCCEHLNRAVVLPREDAERLGFTEVCVLPQQHAGGSLGTVYFASLAQPCVVESLNGGARAGLDIGDTLIGMHLRRVAVPVRLTLSAIGEGHLVAAYTRPPLIGGARAVYPDMHMH